ncbi:hypothetical protein GCM10020258_18520 [Sphingomonas yabuuchiae]
MALPYAEVIGDPIAHSKSPKIHGFWLKALGIEAEYRATHVTPDALPAYFAERKADPNWRGCNITVPHKIAALEHVEDREDIRTAIGATNTAFRDADGALIGTNTDAAGFAAPLKAFDLAGKPVTVIGAGAPGARSYMPWRGSASGRSRCSTAMWTRGRRYCRPSDWRGRRCRSVTPCRPAPWSSMRPAWA